MLVIVINKVYGILMMDDLGDNLMSHMQSLLVKHILTIFLIYLYLQIITQ